MQSSFEFCDNCGQVLVKRPIVMLNRKEAQYAFDTFQCYVTFRDGVLEQERKAS